MVFPVVLRGLPGTSTRNCPHGTSTSKPVVPVRICFKSSHAGYRAFRLRNRLGRGTKWLTASVLGVGVALLLALSAGPASAGLAPADPPLATSSNVHLLGHVPG